MSYKKKEQLVEAVAAVLTTVAYQALDVDLDVSPARFVSWWVVHRANVHYPSGSDAEYVFNLANLGIYEELSLASSSQWREALREEKHDEVRRAAAEAARDRIKPLLNGLEERIWLYQNLRPTTLKSRYFQPHYIYAQAARDAYSRRHGFHHLAAMISGWHRDHRFAYAMEVGASVTAWDKEDRFWAVLRRESGSWAWRLRLEKRGEDDWEAEHPYYILPGKVRDKGMGLKLYYHAHPELGERVSIAVDVDPQTRAHRVYVTAYERKPGGEWRWQPWRGASGQEAWALLAIQQIGLEAPPEKPSFWYGRAVRQGDLVFRLLREAPVDTLTTLPEGASWARGHKDGEFGRIVGVAPARAGEVITLEHPDHPAVRLKVPEDKDLVLVAEQVPGVTIYTRDDEGWE